MSLFRLQMGPVENGDFLVVPVPHQFVLVLGDTVIASFNGDPAAGGPVLEINARINVNGDLHAAFLKQVQQIGGELGMDMNINSDGAINLNSYVKPD